MTTSVKQQKERQPFTLDELHQFCGTKKLAQQLATDLGNALIEADRARNEGMCDDTIFEHMFWDGTLFLTDDDMFDCHVEPCNLPLCCDFRKYDDALDATIHLCSFQGRKIIVVEYHFKDEEYSLSAWFLNHS